jgi:pyruvate/2-oxoglutarate dehydrogenase complex dihydrolipoamide acyltransferase (E2) component
MAIEIVMPQLGESVVEGTIARWLVQEGETVRKDQPLVEVETDKANTEVPSPVAGVVAKLLTETGTVVPVGKAIALLDADAKTPAPSVSATSVSAAALAAAEAAEPSSEPEILGADRGHSPAVRKAAREHGVDLGKVVGTGEGGRITKKDVLAAAESAKAARAKPAPAPAKPAAAPAPIAAAAAGAKGGFRLPPYVPRPGDEVVPFSRRRKLIAEHMVFSKQTAPHVAVVAEIDMHRAVAFRAANKDAWKKRGVGLTFLPILSHAVVRAIREFPKMNARVLEDAYVVHRDVNLGIAVETDQGLVVPVIRQSDEKTLEGLARAIDEVAEKARTGNLAPDDVAGGTFTVSNPGRRGNLFGTAILSQPQVGILRMGEIVKRPVVVEADGEDHIVVRPMMYVCLSYDHRIIDGVYGNGFLARVRDLLEAGPE